MPILILIGLAIILSDGFPVFFKQKRIGLNNSYFHLYKFRTMRKNTPDIPTHRLDNPEKYLIRFGNFLRRYSLDEIPQLINIIKSEMSFIGPRPALHNQDDLIDIRTKHNIHLLYPGITGWAQVNGRDELTIEEKVLYDKFYFENRSLILNIKILFKTFSKVLFKIGVKH